jgi:hypothetical protein
MMPLGNTPGMGQQASIWIELAAKFSSLIGDVKRS